MLLAPSLMARAADNGIAARKLVLINKGQSAQTAKLVYVAKGDPGIQKGPAGDPMLLSGTFRWFYTDDPGGNVDATFNITSDPNATFGPAVWAVNNEKVAKYVNKFAEIAGPTRVKVAVVKPESVAKVAARGLGDEGLAFIDLGPPSSTGGITTVFTVHNGNDGSTHRMCTKFAVADGSTVIYKEIGIDTDRKLVAKNGVPTPCPPVGSPSGAFLDAAGGH